MMQHTVYKILDAFEDVEVIHQRHVLRSVGKKEATKTSPEGCLGGSGVEHLPSAQGVIPQVLGLSLAWGSALGACFSVCLSLPLSVCLNK